MPAHEHVAYKCSTSMVALPTKIGRGQPSERSRIPTILGVISFLTATALIPAVTAMTPELKYNFPVKELDSHLALGSRAANSDTDFNWNNVPLDYGVPNGDKAAVALLRIKSTVSHDSTSYRGPILINPGGPGGSGVLYVDEFGEDIQTILGGEYDIVGFDPRGIGETTPIVSVFTDDTERAYWDAGAPPLINSTSDALPRAFFRAQLFNKLVESRGEQAAQYASTAVVARDMLSITKAHGRDRILYWGISYGSILGATFAAMFPNNVERLIIDGVQDFDDYYSGSWSQNLIDTDKVLQFLYDKCASAGPACPLHANSSALVQHRVDKLLDSVKSSPVTVTNGTDYGVIDFTFVKQLLFQSLYLPFTVFPVVAQALAALEAGDGRPCLSLLRAQQPLPKCNVPPQSEAFKLEGQLAVLCGDAEGVSNELPDLIQHFEKLSNISIFADIWTGESRTVCAGWNVRPTERFAGPFAVNTSFPLLVIGNNADPVTPLLGAQKAARAFKGSALLTINTPGHTSTAATSSCVNKVIRDYFTRGQLPNQGTVCEIEDVLFGTPPTKNSTGRDVGPRAVPRTISAYPRSVPRLSDLLV